MQQIGLRLFIAIFMLLSVSELSAQEKEWVMRLAKIEVDSAYLEEYKAAVKVHTAAAVANEPGVLTLYVMFEKEHPTRVNVLEIYASKEAYQQHIKTPHFLQYKKDTLHMVKSLELIDLDPVTMAAKPDLLPVKKEKD